MVRLCLLYHTSKPAFKLYQIPIPTSSDTNVAQINISTFSLGGDLQGPLPFITNLSLSLMQRDGNGKTGKRLINYVLPYVIKNILIMDWTISETYYLKSYV